MTISSALKYAVLPGIIPRIMELWRSGFATIAALMAQIFLNIGLLPVGHTYVLPHNYGRFGVFNVIMAAKDNLVFSRKHIDQVIIFSLICFAIFSIFAQICAFVLAILMPGAFAQLQLFQTPNPTNDIAFVLLDRIFGVPIPSGAGNIGFFGSCVGDAGNPCTALRYDGGDSATEIVPVPAIFPWAFHLALHQMFAFFSYTIAALSLFIVLYFVAAVILESIQSGTPFGKRFSKLWAPLRLMTAFALIVPVSNGLNLAQYGVLYSAKWGSSLATNVWTEFNVRLATDGIMDANSMVGTPQAQDAMHIVGFTHIGNFCQQVERTMYPRHNMPAAYDKEIGLYLINATTNQRQTILTGGGNYTNYFQADAFSSGGDIVIRVGSLDPGAYGWPTKLYGGRYAGDVFPYCGEIVIPAVNTSSAGTELIRQKYYELIVEMWLDVNNGYTAPNCPNTTFTDYSFIDGAGNSTTVNGQDAIWQFGFDIDAHSRILADQWFKSTLDFSATNTPTRSISEFKTDGAAMLREHLNCIIEAAVDAERAAIAAGNNASVPQSLLNRGWAGAGIWYNRIAEINGGLIDSVNNIPQVTRWPITMTRVSKIHSRNDTNPVGPDLFNPYFRAAEQGAILPRSGEELLARAYYDIYKQWTQDGPGTGGRTQSGNAFESTLALIFGVEGLFSMTQNTTDAVHPLAKLSGLGKSLIESSIRNLIMGSTFMLGDIINGADNALSGAGDMAGQAGVALTSAAGLTLTAGFILFYIVPILPFMYFFFAVGTWIKTVFEAMVGMPLWALSHIHIEGGGLPGQKAANGYYLLFEIFVRPVMIVMGFIASITIFSAMANVLTDIWDIAVANVGGVSSVEESAASGLADKIRTPIDQLFYLIMFTMLLYMVGVSSFKLVDQIPQSILRWIGASVPTFVDQKEDITSSVVSKTAMAATRIFTQFTQGITSKYKETSKSQDMAALQKPEHVLKDYKDVPPEIQRLRDIHAGEWKAIQEQAVYKQLAPHAQGLKSGNVPKEIQDLADRFPRITKGLIDSQK